MKKPSGLGSWLYGLALVGAWVGCTPRTDIGVGADGGSGGEGLSSPQAGSGGSPIDGEGGSPEGGSSGSNAGSSAAAGGDLAGGNGGSTTSGGASGTSGTGGDSGSTGNGGTAGSAGTGGNSGDTGGSAGTGTSGSAGTGGGGGTSGQAGAGGGAEDHCNLDPDVYKDDSPSTSSTVPCGRLGDLSAETGFALDVGHIESVEALSKTATRLLSYDNFAGWVLWDLDTRTMVRRGRSRPWPLPPCAIELCSWPFPRSPVLSDTHLAALVSANAKAFDLEIRSALDGELVATVTMPGLEATSQFGFASDGSYLWAVTYAGIRAWSTDGDLLVESSGGDYHSVSALPGELRIGSPNRNVIEKISIATGESTLSAAFQGTFHSWFVDGARFLTTISTTVRVYSGDTLMQENLFTVPTLVNLTGQGDHVWVAPSSSLDIYALSNPSAPAASYPLNYRSRVFPAGNLIGVVTDGDPIGIIELGPAITQSSVDMPGHAELVFTADEAGNWALGGGRGEVFDGTDLTHSLSCGKVLSIARADDGTTAVSTSEGGVLLFKLTADERRYLGTIPFPSSHVELSRDGLVLAASGNLLNPLLQIQLSLRVFSLPDQTEIKVWPYSAGDSSLLGFSMSSEGNRFGHQVFTAGGLYGQDVRDLDDNVSLSLTESVTSDDIRNRTDNPPRLSADGTLVAVPSGDATNLYDNGVLVNAFPGRPLSWFDDDRLLVELDGVYRVYDSSGEIQPTADVQAEEGRSNTRIVSATEVYSEAYNTIYSLTSGDELWSCGWSWVGAAAANYAVFVSKQAQHKVVFDNY